MQPSSRTPEGDAGRCPVCGQPVCIEPSTYPTRDAPCPGCGHLLWFPAAPPPWTAHHSQFTAADDYESFEHASPDPFGRYGHIQWAVLAVVSAVIVWLQDRLLVSSLLWLLAMLVLGQFILPRAFRWAEVYLREHDNLWVGVIFGWVLVAGLPVGAFLGVLFPYIYDWNVSSLLGGVCGLMIAPPFTALQGLLVAALLNGITWLATGKSLDAHMK